MTATKDSREAGFLNDDRATGGEVATAPVAEPPGIESDVLILRNGKLAFRAPDVIAVKLVIGAEIVGSAETPAVAQEFFSRPVVLDVGRELEGFAGFFRSGDEADELA